ncbi:V-type ATP synthase subunit F [Proteiniclasticum sp. BAD-10]|uniref:V-type ATP synthase subunit F n=1 Tax=Proteiniclasticum sediminis TaxID=2804028 RepID=A0A941CNF8_9CLOT|nr:V-type ATP synthase subunit F [Proteiniclasticum sediminis]MBR0575827.1 V-type ATP synthase subunit F [Proteiniclasticum sediminis]
MYRIGVIGDKDSILPFKALGIDVFPVVGPEETRKTLDTLARDKYGIVFITEQAAQLIPESIDRYVKELVPAVILIPSNQGSLNIGLNKITENVEKAVGSNIL